MVLSVQENLEPPIDRGHDTWSYGGYSGSGNEGVVGGNFLGGGHDGHQSTIRWTDVSAEASTSLAPAKPNNVENNDQSAVSKLFTPQEIMLYYDGLDSSQALRAPPAQRGGMTARGVPRRRGTSSP